VTPLVELRRVSFAYPPGAAGGARRFRLSDVDLAMAPGEVLGVIGPNSAGKTTLIRLLTRVLAPDAGDIAIDGVPLARLGRTDLACRVAVVPQEIPGALPFTVEQLVLMGRYPRAPRRFFDGADDLRAARRAMAMTGVLELAGAPIESLAGGERQRVVLARALAQEPRLLVLDEPTAHLDLRYQAECVRLLRQVNAEQGLGVLLVSHDLNLAAAVSDRLLLMSAGRRVAIGRPEEVLEAALLSRVYECDVTVERGGASGRPRVEVAWPARAARGGERRPLS
jgi:iron complex transport system ATP-binding protein